MLHYIDKMKSENQVCQQEMKAVYVYVYSDGNFETYFMV